MFKLNFMKIIFLQRNLNGKEEYTAGNSTNRPKFFTLIKDRRSSRTKRRMYDEETNYSE